MIIRTAMLAAGFALFALPAGAGVTPRPDPAIAVVRREAAVPGDAPREGAAELMVWLEVARLRREPAGGGLVAVGDRRGIFSPGEEEALRQAVLHGVPVVKLAASGRVLPAPHGLFLDGGGLSAEEAGQVLARCLGQHGALPVSRDERGSGELRARLKVFQQELAVAAGARVASR